MQSGAKWTKSSHVRISGSNFWRIGGCDIQICNISWFTPCLSAFSVLHLPLHRNMWTIMGDQVYSILPSTRQTSLKPWVSCVWLSPNYKFHRLQPHLGTAFLKSASKCKLQTLFFFCFFLKTDREPACPRDGVPLSTWHILQNPAAEAQNSQDHGEGGPWPFTGEEMCDINKPEIIYSCFACVLNYKLPVSF